MGEEVLSPTSPNSPYNSSQPQRMDSRRAVGQGNTTTRARKFSIQKPTKGEWGRNKEKGQNKSRWPGLNVDTNFSKAPALAVHVIDANRNQESGIGTDTKHVRPEFVSLSDTKAEKDGNGDISRMGITEKTINQSSKQGQQLPIWVSKDLVGTKGGAALGLGLEQYEKPAAVSPHTKGAVNNLKRASSKWSNISPSDRAIVIGISIPSSKFADHVMTPDGDSVQPQGLTACQYATNVDPPVTPTIVVTPAKDEAPWSASSSEHVMAYHGRPASSVYSQAVQRSRGMTQLSDIPPVPAYPSMYQVQRGNPDPSGDHKKSPSRIVSSCTVFDEDEGPPMASRRRPYSRKSQLRILTRSSQDSLATRHRSQGWWNYIVSPFLTRSNTIGLRSPSGSAPDLPISSPETGMAREQRVEEVSPGSSQGSPGFEEPKSGHTSFWTEMSRFEAEREKSGLVLDRGLDEHSREALGADSYSPPKPFEGFGEAAEYFQACWHDQNSPTPYFECQNHSCLPKQALDDLANTSGHSEDATTGPNATRVADEIADQNLPEAKAFQQEPANRFSAAFKEAFATKAKPARPISEATEIEELDTTPEVQEAHEAPVVRGGAIVPASQPPEVKADPVGTKAIVQSPQPPQPPPTEPGPSLLKADKPVKRVVAVMPPDHPRPVMGQPLSPGPMPPVARSATHPENTIPLAEISREIDIPPPTQTTYVVNQYHGDPAVWRHREQTTLADFVPQPRFDPPPRAGLEDKDFDSKKKHDQPPRYSKENKSSKFRTCLKFKPRTKKQKWIRAGIAAGLTALILLIVLLAVFLTRKGDNMPVQSQWLNITGYPPIPTGISTIVQPDVISENSGCVQPSTIWGCSLPKEQQPSIAPNAPNQPNFRVEIRFRNGTSPNGTALNATNVKRRSKDGSLNPVSAGSFIRSQLLRARDSFTNSLYIALPSPPNQEDQVFLGNTTDNNTAPFDGEYTPFFMSFEDPSKLSSSQLSKRKLSDLQNLTDPFPDLTKAIPPPDINPDGTAAAANLLPLPSAQPLRLYNRGLPTEHYGFYTYFDRSIFLKSTALVNASSPIGEVPDDKNGGANENAATVRCTWAQTRFLVQIWTNKGTAASLLQNANSTNSSRPTPNQSNPQNLTSSSANDFRRPGSFPYPVTITLDRHGGDITKKLIYCYGLDQREHIILEQKKVQLEDRAFGGTLVNPALGPFGNVNVSRADGGPGGIDGGDGGCGCVWRNFGGG